MKRITITFLFLVTLILACLVPLASVSAGGVDDKSVDKKKEAAGDFVRGVQLWKNNCARCHRMRDPKDLRDDLWDVTMMHMRVRAPLTGQDARDILTFLKQSN